MARHAKNLYIIAFSASLYFFWPIDRGMAANKIIEAGALDEQSLRIIAGKAAQEKLAGQRTSFFYPNGTLAEQFSVGLNPSGDSNDIPLFLDNNLIFFAGCRPHSCDEKSAAILDRESNDLVAMGIRHFKCHSSDGDSGNTTCDSDPSIDVYLFFPAKKEANLLVKNVIENWGARVGFKSITTHRCKIMQTKIKCN